MKRALALIVACLALSACSPRAAVWFHFHDNGSDQLHAEAVRVVDCETGHTWNPDAVSPTNDHGLFQINKKYHYAAFQQVTGQPWSAVYDPFYNAMYARHLYAQKGWQPWTCRP